MKLATFFIETLAVILASLVEIRSSDRAEPAEHSGPEAPALEGSEWTSFRGGPGMEGRRAGRASDRPRKLWDFDAKSEIESTAAIVEGRVFVGTQSGLIALALEPRSKAGELLWKFSCRGVRSSPLVVKGRVYFGDDEGVFRALEASSGKELWKFATESGSEIISSANHLGGNIVFGSYDSTVYCFEAEGGKLSWKLETAGPVHAGPAIAEGHIFVAGCDGRLRIVLLSEGRELSSLEMGSQSAASPCAAGGRLFVGTLGGEVLGVDWKTPKVLWKYAHPERKLPFHSSAALGVAKGEEAIVLGGRDKLVHAIRTKDGKALWTFAAGAEVDSSPVVVGERVFVASKSGNLHLLELASGKEVWRFAAGSGFVASPALARGKLVISTKDGQVLCFSLSAEEARAESRRR